MLITRRRFTAGALSAALAAGWRAPAFGQASAALAPALDAIRAYGNAHLAYFGLPGMTLGLTTPAGFTTTLNFGYANADARTPIGPETLFQIGSISKSMTAAVIHQFAAAGRVRLTDTISSLLPMVPLPAGNGITLQNLLDHTAGLPDDAPMFVPGGLWTGFAPGTHWSYSNTGYAILGRLAEHLGGKPLDRLLAERIFSPLAMRRSRGAIIGADRLLYAQGYEAADLAAPFARGVPLKPAAWVDVTFGAGCVASTADDMMRWLRSLADAAQGRAGLGLPAPAARAFTSHFVPSDTPGMSYGNGLMHVANAGRTYLHHTGGMVSFSSSFHVDTASGVGAFASSTISAFADYRPRLLTRFAVDALTSAAEGRPLPSPPDLATHIANPAAYIGRYTGPAGAFEVRVGNPLTLIANGREAELQPWGGEIFRTTHPDFHAFNLMFERSGGAVTGAAWGPNSFAREGSASPLAPSDPALARLAGRYVNDSPWWGTAIIVERGGKLWIGTDAPLVRIADNLWRVGPESWLPERVSFADFIDGRPQTLIFSGVRFDRHDI
jgi:CubicO group peptidase (beta-lactamase class C family)